MPVQEECECLTLNLDLDRIEASIDSRTKGIMLSPVLGNPPDMDHMSSQCHAKGLMLMLDGCDSLGSKWKGQHLAHAHHAKVTSCSFYPAHHTTTGEDGMVSSNNDDLVKLARRFAWWGRDCY